MLHRLRLRVEGHLKNWLKFVELPIEFYALKLTMGFQQRGAHLSPSWLVNKATSLSQHMVEQGFNTSHKSTTMWKTPWGLSHWEAHDIPTALP